jgi:hypothetical protein
MREGETVVQALARLDAHYQKMSLPGWMDDMVARVASQLKAAQAHMWTPEGFEEAIAKASEKAAVKLNDGIVAATADAVIYRLRDILPPYSKAAA